MIQKRTKIAAAFTSLPTMNADLECAAGKLAAKTDIEINELWKARNILGDDTPSAQAIHTECLDIKRAELLTAVSTGARFTGPDLSCVTTHVNEFSEADIRSLAGNRALADDPAVHSIDAECHATRNRQNATADVLSAVTASKVDESCVTTAMSKLTPAEAMAVVEQPKPTLGSIAGDYHPGSAVSSVTIAKCAIPKTAAAQLDVFVKALKVTQVSPPKNVDCGVAEIIKLSDTDLVALVLQDKTDKLPATFFACERDFLQKYITSNMKLGTDGKAQPCLTARFDKAFSTTAYPLALEAGLTWDLMRPTIGVTSSDEEASRLEALRDLVQGIIIDCNRFSMATLVADGIEKQQKKPLGDNVRACLVDAYWQMSSQTVIETIVNPKFFTGAAVTSEQKEYDEKLNACESLVNASA